MVQDTIAPYARAGMLVARPSAPPVSGTIAAAVKVGQVAERLTLSRGPIAPSMLAFDEVSSYQPGTPGLEPQPPEEVYAVPVGARAARCSSVWPASREPAR